MCNMLSTVLLKTYKKGWKEMYVNSVCLCVIEAWSNKYIGTNLGQTLRRIESKNYL